MQDDHNDDQAPASPSPPPEQHPYDLVYQTFSPPVPSTQLNHQQQRAVDQEQQRITAAAVAAALATQQGFENLAPLPPLPVKKKRGRPLGTKNKSKALPVPTEFPTIPFNEPTPAPEPELDPTLFNFPLDHEHDIAINPPPVFPPPPPPVVADVKRGRGRPKGSKDKPKEPAQLALQLAKGRTAKKRGRPPGVKNKPKDSDYVAPPKPPGYIERRGRPKGSKNKPKLSWPSPHDSSSSSLLDPSGSSTIVYGHAPPPQPSEMVQDHVIDPSLYGSYNDAVFDTTQLRDQDDLTVGVYGTSVFV